MRTKWQFWYFPPARCAPHTTLHYRCSPQYYSALHVYSTILIFNTFMLHNTYFQYIYAPKYLFSIHLCSPILIFDTFMLHNTYFQYNYAPQYFTSTLPDTTSHYMCNHQLLINYYLTRKLRCVPKYYSRLQMCSLTLSVLVYTPPVL